MVTFVFQVYDNASYHSKKDEDNTPKYGWKKDRLRNWLTKNNVQFPELALKDDLWALAREKASKEPRYKVDDLVRQYGHEVLRLPPYHCELNPIERIQATVKGRVGRQNVDKTLNGVFLLGKKEMNRSSQPLTLVFGQVVYFRVPRTPI